MVLKNCQLLFKRTSKEKSGGFPLYKVATEKETAQSNTYSLQKKNEPVHIRTADSIWKLTALHLLQENISFQTTVFFASGKNSCPTSTTSTTMKMKRCARKTCQKLWFACFTCFTIFLYEWHQEKQEFSGDYVDLEKS